MGNILCDIVLSNISLYLPSQVRGKKAKQQQQQQQQTDEPDNIPAVSPLYQKLGYFIKGTNNILEFANITSAATLQFCVHSVRAGVDTVLQQPFTETGRGLDVARRP